jgi:integrase
MFPLAAPYTPSPRKPLLLVMDRGGVYLRPDSPFWMIRFRLKGCLFRESSRARSKKEALAYLRRRMAEFGLGSAGFEFGIPTLGEAAEALLSHMRAANRSGYAEVRSHLRSIVAHFGMETRLAEVSPERMDAFMAARRASGLRDDSVYNEMSTLRRCLRLQWKRNRLLVLPTFPMPAKGKARQGFFTAEEVERLCGVLPPHAVNAVRFAWETGWRRGEIFGLRWEDVNLESGVIYLSDSKNGEGRQLPFGESEVLARIIREQRASASAFELRRGRRVTHVFHYKGRHLPEGLKRCWKAACRRAGLEARLFHDLRRSFIQRCEDHGIARSSAMKITGHKTEAIYARYAIAPRASISAALRRLAETTQEERQSGRPNRRRPLKLGDAANTD